MFLTKIVILTAQIINRHKNRWVQQLTMNLTFLKSAQKILANDIYHALHQA